MNGETGTSGISETGIQTLHRIPFTNMFTPDTFQVALLVFGKMWMDNVYDIVAPVCLPGSADFTFTSDTTNLTISFATTSTNVNSFFWDFGDGGTATGQIIHHMLFLIRIRFL
ncbi:MAG: PKD domain-containing protein [Bacteroidia bacterium]